MEIEKLKQRTFIFAVLLVVLAAIGVSQGVLDFATSLFVKWFPSAALSALIGMMILAIVGNSARNALLKTKVLGFTVTVSYLFIATPLVKLVLLS